MQPEIELVTWAYEQVGQAYRCAVDVSKFTWQMFAGRNVVLLTAAGYVYFKTEFPYKYEIAAFFLVVGAIFNVRVTARQMRDNQDVIAKVIASGCILEIIRARAPHQLSGVGYRRTF